MNTLDHIFADVDARVTATREAISISYGLKVAGAGGMGGSAAASGMTSAASPFGSSDIFGNRASTSAARQYIASMSDTPATAIRPVAVKVADQVIHAGARRISSVPSAGMMQKSASDFLLRKAPAAIRHKAISEGITTLESHPFLDAIANPNPLFTQWALMFCTAWSIEACGEAVWIIDPTTDEIGNPTIRIWYYPRHWVQPVHEKDNTFSAWKLTPPGVAEDIPPIPASLVCHFFYPDPSNPLAAFSPTQSQAKSINVESKIRDAHLATMNNAIEPGLLLIAGHMDTPPGQSGKGPRIELTPTQRKQIIEAVKLVYRGVQHRGDPLILDGLIEDAKPYRASATDLDLQGGYKLARDGVMQGIGTNPIMAGMVEGTNRASSYVAQDNFFSIKVNPLITMMSQCMTRTFGQLESMRPSRKSSVLVLWIEEAKPHDADLKLSEMSFLASKNWLRPGEAREAFDLPPIPELDAEWEERRKNPPVPPMPGTTTQGKLPANQAGGEKHHDWHFDDLSLKAAGYNPPESAQSNARRVLKWKQEHGDAVKGMTSVGWARARQLASGKPVSLDTVRRMAQFNRHRSNYEKARAKQKSEGGNPWEYAGIVAWLGWGGTSGVNWAIRTSKANSKSISEYAIESEPDGGDKLQSVIAKIWSEYP